MLAPLSWIKDYVDIDVTPGSTYFYTIKVTDERNGAPLTVATIPVTVTDLCSIPHEVKKL